MDSSTTTDEAPPVDFDAAVSAPIDFGFLSGPTAWLMAPTTAAGDALSGAGFTVSETADGASVAVVSTRLPRHRMTDLLNQAVTAGMRVLVLTHPGGEAMAAEAVKNGAFTAVAEGDVSSLNRLALDPLQPLDYPPGPESAELSTRLVDAYEARVVRGGANRGAESTTNPTSGLPSAAALKLRLAANDLGNAVRVMSFAVVHFQYACTRLSPEAVSLLLRRLAVAFRAACETHGELFDLDEGTYLLLAPGLEQDAAERIARAMAMVTEAYTPDPQTPLFLAVGHAGPECSGDLSTLRELATRAQTAAALENTSTVLAAAELVGTMATDSELEVTLRLAEMAAQMHSELNPAKVAQIAFEIATGMGFEGPERMQIRFVAHVANLGLARVPAEGGDDTGTTHPLEAATYLMATAGPLVAYAVRHCREQWDGSGFPEGLAGSDIPTASRVTAVAQAVFEGGYRPEVLTAGAGTAFDPTVVEAAIELLRDGALHP